MTRKHVGVWVAGLCLLALATLGIGDLTDDRAGANTQRPVVRGVPPSTLPGALLQHFRNLGISLREQGTENPPRKIWLIENLQVGSRCTVFTTFLVFPREAQVASARNYLQGISLPSVLNEREMLAMFYPTARGTTSDPTDCKEWVAQMNAITSKVLEAFKSYDSTPRPAPDKKE